MLRKPGVEKHRWVDFGVQGNPGLESEFLGRPGLYREILLEKNEEATQSSPAQLSSRMPIKR